MRSISPYEKYGKALPDADASLAVHVVTATDTITSLAHKYHGDWRQWRVIATRNKLTDVRQIEVGSRLVIPQQELEKGRYEST